MLLASLGARRFLTLGPVTFRLFGMGSDLGPRPPTKAEIALVRWMHGGMGMVETRNAAEFVALAAQARRRTMRRGPPPVVRCPSCGCEARLRKAARYVCQRSRGGCGSKFVRAQSHLMPGEL
jgi:hypothetical protein